jgi:acetolactate decarboxylase
LRKQIFTALTGIIVGVCVWCTPAHAQRDTLTQFSTIDALLGGLYAGEISMTQLKNAGDFGIGTFDALDGEMVVYKGSVYRVQSDGRALEVADTDTTPFASVTTFVPDQHLALPAGLDFEKLPAWLEQYLAPNYFHAILIEGRFAKMRTRSVPAQHKPYRPLVEVVKEQPVFEFDDVDGVLIGFYCPSFVQGVNVPGYHLHFLTAERNAGGHVLDFSVCEASVQIDTLQRFVLHLPTSSAFAKADLNKDRKHELEKVEK